MQRKKKKERKKKRKEGKKGGEEMLAMEATATTVGAKRRNDRMEERQKKEDTPVFTREFTPPVRLFPSSEWPNRIESSRPCGQCRLITVDIVVYVRTC